MLLKTFVYSLYNKSIHFLSIAASSDPLHFFNKIAISSKAHDLSQLKQSIWSIEKFKFAIQ